MTREEAIDRLREYAARHHDDLTLFTDDMELEEAPAIGPYRDFYLSRGPWWAARLSSGRRIGATQLLLLSDRTGEIHTAWVGE